MTVLKWYQSFRMMISYCFIFVFIVFNLHIKVNKITQGLLICYCVIVHCLGYNCVSIYASDLDLNELDVYKYRVIISL